MTHTTNNKPKARKAELNDFTQIYPLLQEINDIRLDEKGWHKLFENHWNIDEFSPGLVLETEQAIAGFISTIYSTQLVAGKEQVFCNLTSWIVKEAWRSYSFMMILPLVRNKNIVLTSFSSNDVTYELYKKLGFKDGFSGRRIQVDKYLLGGHFLWFSRQVKRGNPYQYKTALEHLPPPSPEYSEIFLLNM